MRKPYVYRARAKNNASTSREDRFKSERPYREVLIERHGLERAIEIMEVRSEQEFRRYCNRHGILEGGQKARDVYVKTFKI